MTTPHPPVAPRAVGPGLTARRAREGVTGENFVLAIGLLLVAAYLVAYLGTPKLPGNEIAHPRGWWGWFDQGETLRSTAALAHGNLDPAEHHYPLGYSLLGLPFFFVLPNHPFFFVDLFALMGAFAGFVAVGRRLGLAPAVPAALFALTMLSDRALFLQWVVPWNTTPVGAFAWLLVANVAAWLDGTRRPGLIGVLIGAIVACRPSDGLIALPCLATLAWAERHAWRAHIGPALRLAAGGGVVILPVLALHLAIYGPAQSSYMASSAQIGFTLHEFGWKAYVLLVDPWPWFADGEGLLQHAPWIALGVMGIAPALLGGAKARLLASVLVIHSALYVAYVDLLPVGLWRFLNVHYFLWSIPGYALLAAILVRDLIGRGRRARVIAGASVLATGLVLCLAIIPAPTGADKQALAIDYDGPPAAFLDLSFSHRLMLQDGRGVLNDMRDIRAFVVPGGLRVFGLRRGIVGPLAWLPGHAPLGYKGSAPSRRWKPKMRLVWPPAWLRPAPPSPAFL